MPAMQRPILPRYRPAYTYPGLFRIYLLSPYFHKPCAFSVLLAPSYTRRISFLLSPRAPFLGTYFKEIRETRKSEREKYGKPKLSSQSLDFKGRDASCIFLIFQLFFLSFLFFVKIENERKRENRFSFFRPTILHFFHSIIIETQLSMFLLLLLPKEPRKYS